MPNITLPDGSVRSFDAPVSVFEVAASIGAGLAKAALAGKVEGAVVDTARDGKEALALLAAKTYDVLISDVSMPVMDGFELVAAARKLPMGHRLLAVAVTGYGRDVDVRNALDAGFDAHVAKPVAMAQLQAALDSL